MSKPATLYAALVAAQQAMGPVLEDKTNPAFRSKYADLESVLRTVRGPLNDNGLVLLQPLAVEDGRQLLKTVIVHADSGEFVESVAEVRCADPDNPQKVGGAITYMRRYSILSLLGLAPEDDDGQLASQPRQQPQPRNTPVTRSEPRHATEPPEDMESPEMDLGDVVLAGFFTSIEHAATEKQLDAIGTEIKRSRLTPAERELLRDPFARKLAAFQATS